MNRPRGSKYPPEMRRRMERGDVADHRASEDPLPVTLSSWTDREGREWLVGLTWDVVDDRYEVVGVSMESVDEQPVAVTKAALKQLPLDRLEREDRATFTETLPQFMGKWNLSDDHRAELEHTVKQFGAHRGVALGPDGLAAVAAVYRQARLEKRPVQAAVAEAFNIAKGTAANRILQARREGYIPPANPKAGES